MPTPETNRLSTGLSEPAEALASIGLVAYRIRSEYGRESLLSIDLPIVALTGMRPERLCGEGRDLAALVRPSWRQEILPQLKRAHARPSWEFSIPSLDAQGRPIWLLDRGIARRDEHGRRELVGILYDDTARAEFEATRGEDLERLRESWDEIRAQRAHLAEQAAELHAFRAKAEAASRAKDEFLAMISHEIRTPMNAVIGMCDLLRASELDELQDRQARIIQDSAEALVSIIGDVLDYSKIEADKLELEAIEFDPREVVEGALETLSERARRAGIELFGSVAPDVPARLVGDPLRLRQVWINLVGNAVKFTAEGEVELRLELAPEPYRRHGQISLVGIVRDTGIGMGPTELAKLFQSYSQADPTTTRRYGGTGLGLVIAKRLVERMHGEIGVESVVGEGSTFRFDVHLPVGEPVGLETIPLGGRRAFVVHRSEAAARALALRLDEAGAATEVHASGESALAALTLESVPDLVLFDESAGDPIDWAWRLREAACRTGAFASPAVVALASPDAARLGPIEEPLAGRVLKPVRREEWTRTLHTALGLDAGGSAPSRSCPLGTVEPLPPDARVLLVEDDRVNRAIALAQLGQLGLDAQIAEDGRAALERLRTEPFDLVLMDCQMPVLDGYEATREFRASEEGAPRTPIIALTAEAFAGYRETCLRAGMDDFLSKPVRVVELARVCRQWLAASESRAARLAAEAGATGGEGSPKDTSTE